MNNLSPSNKPVPQSQPNTTSNLTNPKCSVHSDDGKDSDFQCSLESRLFSQDDLEDEIRHV